MSSRLQRNLKFLKALKKCRNRNILLKNASDDSIACIVESLANILKGKLRLNKNQKSKLSKHIKVIRQISKTRSAPSARKIIIQKGGSILAVVLPLIVSAAASIIGRLFKKK